MVVLVNRKCLRTLEKYDTQDWMNYIDNAPVIETENTREDETYNTRRDERLNEPCVPRLFDRGLFSAGFLLIQVQLSYF